MNICGDFYLSQIDSFKLSSRDILGEVFDVFVSSEMNIVNLEAPITTNNTKIIKTGPHLKHSPAILDFLKNSNINVVTLANNHILDFGEDGLNHTFQYLNTNYICKVGAAENIVSAGKPLKKSIGDSTIAIINICENEWSVASANKAGTNPLDVIENVKQIKEAKKYVDFVLVIIHGGHENYNLPSPRMVKQYRYFAENGADMIIGHHSHCFSGYEIYNNVPIFYSLGNFLFALKSKYSSWYTGLILQLSFKKEVGLSWRLIPVQQSQIDFKLSIPTDESADKILKEVENLSEIIKNESLLINSWKNFLLERENSYLANFSFINSIPLKTIRLIFNRMGISKRINSKRYLSYLLNMLRCEAHNDISQETIKRYLRDK